MRFGLIIFILFFSLGLQLSYFGERQNVIYSHTKKARFIVQKISSRMPASIDDDGAEEDESQVISHDCAPPQICPARRRSGTGSELNPIASAFSGYSASDMVSELIRIARDQIRVNPGRYIVKRTNGRVQAYCYGAVKDALRSSGMLSGDFSGSRFAKNAVEDLEAEEAGFRNLLDFPDPSEPSYDLKVAINSMLVNNPDMAPRGTVLVYSTVDGAMRSNGKPVDPAGHVEIKIGDVGEGGYISVSERDEPTYGYSLATQRTLIGVMYQPRLLSPDSIYYLGQIPF